MNHLSLVLEYDFLHHRNQSGGNKNIHLNLQSSEYVEYSATRILIRSGLSKYFVTLLKYIYSSQDKWNPHT